MTEQASILFVDDEKNILKSLYRLFMDEPYRLLFAGSGQEGLSLLQQGERPTLIISDQRMPEMGGVEFLIKSQEIVPNAIRMVLTGYADINAAIDAVNLGGVSRYLMKPWDDDILKNAVRDAITCAELRQKNQELTEQLTERNRMLEELNSNLEQKVEERTLALKNSYEKNLLLTKKLRKKIQELEGRDRLQRHLLTLHSIEETLRELLEVSAVALHCDFAAAYLCPFRPPPLTPDAYYETSTNVRGSTAYITPESASLEQVAQTGIPSSKISQAENNGQETFLAHMICPINGGEERLGVVVLTRFSSHPFDDEEIKVLMGFCALAAIAIRDARLNSELSSFGASLDDILGRQ